MPTTSLLTQSMILRETPRTITYRLSRQDCALHSNQPERRKSQSMVNNAIMYTCRRLSRLGYSIVYGENHFVFDHAARSAMASIAVSEINQSRMSSRLRAWSKPPETSWPLTVRSRPFVRHLAVLTQLTGQPRDNECATTSSQVNQLLRLFSRQAQSETLRRGYRHLPAEVSWRSSLLSIVR